MNTNEEYDKHLQDFYGTTFREYAMKYGIGKKTYSKDTSDAQKHANEMLMAYGAAVNQSIAYELLNKIEITAITPEDKLNAYPSMFWLTENGKNVLENITNRIIDKESKKLFAKEDLILEDIKSSFLSIITFAKDVCLKDSEQGYRMVANFNTNLKYILEAKIEEKQLTISVASDLYDKVLKQVIDDKMDCQVPAFYMLESHLHGIKAEQNYNPEIFQTTQKARKLVGKF